MSYEAITTTSGPPHYFKFLSNKSCHTFPLASSTSFTHLWIFGCHYNRVMDSVRPDYTQIPRICTCAVCYWQQNLWSWDSFPQLPKYQDDWIIGSWIKQFYCH